MKRWFRYAIDRKLAPFWMVFGVRPGRDGVTVTDDEFVATFGVLRIATPIDNVTGAHVAHGYRWWKVVGARRSFADDGLTFGTSATRGVCVHFDRPVNSVLRRRGHSALTVTVADCDGLVVALSSRASQ